ncbi:MAG: TetR/AcrR family transcriptional regulator [Clostridia bacterium]|nr:TetR/AcrR family transcriptional regulator [Oscillospiraceae bacterium]MBQ7033465.1 TetR/AcrR family transcriptional regulator [Clostridia bacterium]
MTDTKDTLIYDEISEKIIELAGDFAMQEGARNVTVRKILRALGVTNRVFYNRFHNMDEVLELVYRRAALKMRETIQSEIDITTDFFGYVQDVAVKTLLRTYEIKRQFSQFAFEFDSSSSENFVWWTNEIKKMITIGRATGQIKDVDAELLSYAVWCFVRGYNADAVKRSLSREEAVRYFTFGLDCLMEGIRK